MQTPIIHKNKSILTPVLIILLVLIGGYFSYAYFSGDSWPFRSEGTTAPRSYEQDSSTSGSTRTIEDDAESQDAKKRIIEEEDDPSASKERADVVITSAKIINGYLEVRAFTDSVIESGECTLVAAHESLLQSLTSPAFIDASSTICQPFRINTDELADGTWSITVAVKTASSEGQSEMVEVDI